MAGVGRQAVLRTEVPTWEFWCYFQTARITYFYISSNRIEGQLSGVPYRICYLLDEKPHTLPVLMDYWGITQENGVCVPCVLRWMDRYDLIYISLQQPWSRSCSLLPFYFSWVPTYLHPNGHSLSCWVCMNLEGNYIPAIPLWFLEDLTSIQESPNLHKYHLENILNIIIVTAIQFPLSNLSSSSSLLSCQSGSRHPT